MSAGRVISEILASELSFLFFGTAFLIMGVLTKLGIYRSWYWQAKQNLPCGFIPFGLLLIVYGKREYVIDKYGLGILLVSLIFLIYLVYYFIKNQPRWLSPKWVNLLEDTYSKADLNLLKEDAKRNGRYLSACRTNEKIKSWYNDVINSTKAKIGN